MFNIVSINVFLLPFLAIGVILLINALLQYLWNITMPEVFNLKTLTFWQAFRLILIAAILFGGANFRWG